MAGPSRRNAHLAASNGNRAQTCPPEGDSLVTVVAACQKGDRGACRQLYDACLPSVFGLAVRIVGSQDAADVTQQVFLQAFRCLGQFNGGSRFETWLYRLAVNESLQHLRRNKRWKHQSLDWEPTEESHSGKNAEQRELLEQSLGSIDAELRAIFLLREVEGLSYHEIAETLQIAEGTVGSRLNRARRELKQHLSDLGLQIER